MEVAMLQGTSLDQDCKTQKIFYFGSDQVLVHFTPGAGKRVYLRLSGVKLSAYATSVLFPSPSCALGFILQTLYRTLSRLRYEANCQGALTMPEAYWRPLGGQLCRKTDLNPGKILECLV
jgi:hypothetical protein